MPAYRPASGSVTGNKGGTTEHRDGFSSPPLALQVKSPLTPSPAISDTCRPDVFGRQRVQPTTATKVHVRHD